MKKFSILFSLSIIILCLVSGAGPARGAAKDDLILKLQEKYEGMTTFSASFIQNTRGGIGEVSPATGRAYFKKPGKMRWIYTLPVKDEIISNGFRVWVYQPDLGQVVETMVNRNSSSIARNFLSGIGNIKRDFIAVSAVNRGSYHRLELVPRFHQPELKRLFLEVRSNDFIVRRFTIMGPMGRRTEVMFSNIEIDRSISDSFFEFVPPPDVGIIVR